MLAMIFTSPSWRISRRGFSLLELLVAMAVLTLIVFLLASMNNQSLALLRRSGTQAQIFGEARTAFDAMIAQVGLATMNAYWDYDDAENPSRYLRKAWLAFVSGDARTVLGAGYGPGQCVFFVAPSGRMDDAGVRQLNQVLNTCGFFVEYDDANAPSPGFMALPQRLRYRLMEVRSSGEGMRIFSDRLSPVPVNSWITSTLPEARMLAENVLLLVVRPLGADGANLATTGYTMDTRLGESANPQPLTANQLPPFVEIVMVAASEESMRQIDPAIGFVFTPADVAGLFDDPSQFETDLRDFESFLIESKVDFRTFSQRIALPNSKWSE
jgi:uncharacterized protein (TIGR02599 family)